MKTKILPLSIVVGSLVVMILQMSCESTSKSMTSGDYDIELITSWNRKIMELAVEEDRLLTLKGVRTAAMMHIAMHDALNVINPQYAHYAYTTHTAKDGASPVAAAAQAAFEVASNQFPKKQEMLQNELNRWLNTVSDKEARDEGIKIGKASSSEILKVRADDNYNGEADYAWSPMAPGVYAEFNEHSGTPEGFVFGAGWAMAEPFMLETQDQFKAPSPPEITSDAYTKAYNEVKAYGKFDSEVRTADQTHLAMWWKDFVENSHNRLARELVIKENLNLWNAARLFALLNMAIFDAYVNIFDNKFYYNHWRPYTAIRWAAHDGNPDTKADTTWNNLHKHTYAFPSYPSAHGSASMAAMTVLANTLGKGDNYEFTMTTREVDKAGPFSEKIKMDPPTRSFKSFTEAGKEAAMSRVYLGIHFRYDSEEGYKLGSQIGQYATDNFLSPLDDTNKKMSSN